MFELFHCQVCWEFKQGQPPETSLSSVPEMGKMKIWILLSRSTGLGSKEIWRHNFAFKLMKGKKKNFRVRQTYSLTLSVTPQCVCVCVCVCGGSAFGWQIGSKLFTKRQYLFYWIGTKNVSKDVPRWNLLIMKWSLWHFGSPGAFASKVLSALSFPIVHIPGSNQAIFPDPSIIQHSLPFQDLHSPYRLHHFIKYTLPCLPGFLSPFRLPQVYSRLPFLAAAAPSILLSCKHKLGLFILYNVNWKLVKWERNCNAGAYYEVRPEPKFLHGGALPFCVPLSPKRKSPEWVGFS